jgi:hypothetical protein
LLPGGLGHLPDIAASAPAALRPLFQLARPRSYRQLARHVSRHREWYVRSSGGVVRWHRLAWLPALVSLGAAMLFVSGGLDWLLHLGLDVDTPLLGIALAFLSLGVVLFVVLVGGVAVPLAQLPALRRDSLNAGLLYNYLLEAYAEQACPKAPD